MMGFAALYQSYGLPQNVWRELKILAATTDSTIDKLMRRGIDLLLAEHKANRS